MDKRTIAMTIAGFDPSGGAGILNDIKTFESLGVYGTAVITALTAQNVHDVAGLLPVDTEFIEKQMDTVLEGEDIGYAKTGMLYSPEIVKTIASKVQEYKLKLVVDPVMVAGSGGSLSKKDFAESLKKDLLPLAVLTTPNIHEAEILSGMKIENEEDAVEAALEIGKYCDKVVVTGGHLKGSDIFYNSSIQVFEGELLESDNTHGSGCTYSSAVTAMLSKGWDTGSSIKFAGKFVKESIRHGSRGTLNQMWKFEDPVQFNLKSV
ncbi:bifunctional hydroxymethylpyrimidine kinase/phosphomethylpyrimidine kinase [Methanobacterium aggregans]|uniref:bifunctional hydroxymethylpyrimidine kinase/phosphomethylpyrimidine kinase n=1 Tax=Methanobacterium aggregans TaxID=1615586 RepID=UPI001AE46E2B|nr:bifunctional hydroxymethylpyrimidine kinase/phosphomethylpyrimidine kinase [Methanobacterium aggregans]MBP2045094.1 hydroxymethylpyrimidine/phosphomethylpyrimidine kinase [Methanobacterium aggregans]